MKKKIIEEFSKRKPNFCLKCLKQIAQKKFDSSPKGKEKAKRYSQTERGREKIKRANFKKKETGYKKRWRSSPENKEKAIEYNREYSKQNREIKNAHAKTQRQRYPEKESARNKLKRAVRLGRILRPEICSICNTTPKRIEGHHEDYSKPFDVVWLCSPCHRKLHLRS